MKKFLFTLVTLFLATSAFAQNEYLYIEDFEVPDSVMQITSNKNRKMVVPMKAHFQNYVSTMMYTFIPSEGITVYDCAAGSTYTIDYYDKNDNLIAGFSPSFGFTQSTGIGIAAVLLEEGFYYPEGTDPDEDDPVSYGNPKWIGDYPEWAVVTIRFAADFTGGTLDIKSEPSCTPDPRGPISEGVEVTKTTVITVEQAQQDKPAPTPTFREAEGKLYAECEGHTVVLMIDGVAVDNPYTLPAATYEVQTINFTAYTVKTGDETENSAEVPYTVTIQAKEKDYAPAPTIVVTDEGVIAQGPEGYTTVLMLEGEVVNQPYPLPAANYTADQVLNFSAYTVKKTEYYDSETVERTITVEKLEKKDATAPTIVPETTTTAVNVTVTADPNTDGDLVYSGQPSYERTHETYTVTVYAFTTEGDTYKASDTTWLDITVPALEKDVTPEIVINDEVKTDVVTISAAFVNRDGATITLYIDDVEKTNPVDMPRLEEDYYVTAYAEGYISDWATKSEKTERILIPKKEQQQQDQADAPGIGVTYGTGGDHTAYVNITTSEENATIYYSFTGEDGSWMEYTGQLTFTENGSYTVYAYVEVPGKDNSEVNHVSFSVSPSTGMTDVMTGKTIANQRYFNLAGQEMQEVNGLTIVLTTYTDGTTSAVKVLK